MHVFITFILNLYIYMSKILKPLACLALTLPLLPLTSCIDDNYDLDDINTDIEVKVNDLVVPIQLDAIKLSNVFDLDEGSVIKEINGEYAVVVDGDFKGEPTHVSPVTITPSPINPIRCDIFKYEGSDIDLPIGAQAISYEINEATTSFTFASSEIDRTIQSLNSIKGTWDIDVMLDLDDNNGLFQYLGFRKLVVTIPAGFMVENYPCENGNVTIGDIDMNIGGPTYIKLHVSQIDFSKFDSSTFKFTPATGDVNNGEIEFHGKIGVASGFVVGSTNSTSTNIPQNVQLQIDPILNSIDVASVSGTIAFSLSGFSVADVDLSNIPDMLRRPGTDISLCNPQLYASFNNPMAYYNLEASSGLTLEAIKNGNVVNTCSLDAGQTIMLSYNKGLQGPYNFCMAPTRPEEFYGHYTGAQFVGYKTLSNLLSGDGLPEKIHVEFVNPHVLPGEVRDFTLDSEIAAVEGNYTLYAPLALSKGSKIVYEEDEIGWNDDETFDKITVTTLKITAKVYNSLPAAITLSGTLLDSEGKPCVDAQTGKPAVLNGFTVAANTTSDVELSVSGTISGLDGIIYSASCDVTEVDSTLRPDSPIELTDIRVTVSGYYRDTL